MEELDKNKGVYFLLDSLGNVVYVGASIVVSNRIKSHRRSKTINFDTFLVSPISCRAEMYKKEAELIKLLKPIYNLNHNSDNYIRRRPNNPEKIRALQAIIYKIDNRL